MAVIKQQRQFFNKPIGVVRASQGGALVAEAVGNLAQEVSDIAYETAAANAKKRGEEKALAKSTSSIAALDPETNKPIAYTPPSGFGAIASAAYQEMIDRRFSDSITRELEAKGSALAQASSTAAQYKDGMASYVKNMYDAGGEDTSYKRLIQEAGQDYVSKTYAALRKKEIDAERARIKKEDRLRRLRNTMSIKNRLESGDTSEELQADIAAMQNDALNAYAAGSATISDVTSAFDMSNGYNALIESGNLMSIYTESTEIEQNNIEAALRDPVNMSQYVKSSDLQDTIRTVLRGKGTSSEVISALQANEKVLTENADLRDDQFLEANPVTADMSIAEIKSKYSGQPANVISQAFENKLLLLLEPELEGDNYNLETIVNELQKPDGTIDTSVLPEGAKELLEGMLPSDIEDVVQGLGARRTALSGIQAGIEKAEKKAKTQAELDAARFLKENPATSDMSFTSLKALYVGQPKESLSTAMADLFLIKMESVIGSQGANINRVIEELSKPKALIDQKNLPSPVWNMTQSMTPKEISGLVTNLKSRQSILDSKQSEALNISLGSVAARMQEFKNLKDLNKVLTAYPKILAEISNIPDATKQADKRNALDSDYANLVSQLVSTKGISLDRLGEINSAILGNKEFTEGTDEELDYYKSVSAAHDLVPSAIKARMSDFALIKETENKAIIEQSTFESAEELAKQGKPLSQVHKDALQERYYGDEVPTPEILLKDEAFLGRASANTILSVEYESIEAGLKSGNPATQIAAFDLFRKLTNVQQDIGDTIVTRDFLAGKIDEDTYNAARSSIIVSSFAGGIPPTEVLANMLGYRGNLDGSIRDGLNIKSVREIFTESELKMPEMSAGAQEEFLSIVRYAAASDVPINPESLIEMKNRYMSDMVEDERVLAMRVGDSTRFGLSLAFDDIEVNAVYGHVIAEMSEDPMFAEYLKTKGIVLRIASGMNPFSSQLQEAVQSTMINKFIKFEPIRETWVGDDSDKAYIVKIRDNAGGYMTMMPSGYPVIVSQSMFADDESNERSTLSYYNSLTAAVNSGNKRGTAKAGLEYLINLDPDKYTDLNSVRSIPRDEYFINEQLTDDEVKAIIEEMQSGE